MTDLPTPLEIETRAKAAGLTMKELCRRAGIWETTFQRWKGGSEPGRDRFLSMLNALEKAERCADTAA